MTLPRTPQTSSHSGRELNAEFVYTLHRQMRVLDRKKLLLRI